MDQSPTSTEFTVHEDRLDARLDGAAFAIAVVTATRPDCYKQAPVVTATADIGEPIGMDSLSGSRRNDYQPPVATAVQWLRSTTSASTR